MQTGKSHTAKCTVPCIRVLCTTNSTTRGPRDVGGVNVIWAWFGHVRVVWQHAKMAVRAPSFKFKTAPVVKGGGQEEGDKEIERLRQELEVVEYERQSARRHAEDLRSEIKELMRQVSSLREENSSLQQQKQDSVQREEEMRQQLNQKEQEQHQLQQQLQQQHEASSGSSTSS